MPSPANIVPLSLQLYDGKTDQFPMALVRDPSGAVLFGGPVALTHVASGLYQNLTKSFGATTGVYCAQYFVYEDAGHTQLSTAYEDQFESFDVFTISTMSNALLQSALDAIGRTSPPGFILDSKTYSFDVQGTEYEAQSAVAQSSASVVAQTYSAEIEIESIQAQTVDPNYIASIIGEL